MARADSKAQKMKELRRGPVLEPSERARPGRHLNVRLLAARNIGTINVCRFKPPRFWYFVTAALRNK